MKILLPVKQVADPNAAALIRPVGSNADITPVRMSLNPFDETAAEEAVRIKEQGDAEEIVAVTIGPAAAAEALRTVLAMGADRAILVETDKQIQPLEIAKILTKICGVEKPDLILMGRQATDDDCAQTGPMLAQMLGLGQAVGASQITLKDQLLTVRCEVENGTHTLTLPIPAVVTTDLHLNLPRYVTLPGLMKAKRKPLDVVAATDLGIDLAPHIKTTSLNMPPQRAPGVSVSDAETFLDRIFEMREEL